MGARERLLTTDTSIIQPLLSLALSLSLSLSAPSQTYTHARAHIPRPSFSLLLSRRLPKCRFGALASLAPPLAYFTLIFCARVIIGTKFFIIRTRRNDHEHTSYKRFANKCARILLRETATDAYNKYVAIRPTSCGSFAEILLWMRNFRDALAKL
jgi:hypothetical protein